MSITSKASRASIQRYLNTIPPNQYGLATRHASFRAIKTFYRWLHLEYGISNPIDDMSAPILGKPILPSLEQSQVLYLIEHVSNVRDKVIIALFTESGLRLSELVNIRLEHIDWGFRVLLESWARAEKNPMLHSVNYPRNTLKNGLPSIKLMVTSGG